MGVVLTRHAVSFQNLAVGNCRRYGDWRFPICQAQSLS